MEEIINKYLTETYYIHTSDVGNDGIYRHDDSREFKVPINNEKIYIEINQIFGYNKYKFFDLLNFWCVEQKDNVDLSFYWKTNKEIVETVDMGFTRPMIGKLPKSNYIKYLDFITEQKKLTS